MPWPGGDPPASSWKRCHFMECESTQVARIEIEALNLGTTPRAVCKDHRALIRDAIHAGLPIMVTPASVYGAATVQGGTIWINTIADFWFGKRRPFT